MRANGGEKLNGRNKKTQEQKQLSSSTSVFTEARARRMMRPPGAGRLLLLFTLFLALALLVARPAAASLRYQHNLSDSRNKLSTVDDDGRLLLVRVCRVHSTAAATYAAHSRRRCDFVSVGEALAAARDHSVVDVEAGRYLESTIRVRATNVTLRYIAPSLVRPSWPLSPPPPQPPPNPNDDL